MGVISGFYILFDYNVNICTLQKYCDWQEINRQLGELWKKKESKEAETCWVIGNV